MLEYQSNALAVELYIFTVLPRFVLLFDGRFVGQPSNLAGGKLV